MIEFDKWYIAKNGWAFLFLFSIKNKKYGIAMNTAMNSGYVYTKEKENLSYNELKKEHISNNILFNFYENISIVKQMFIKNVFKEQKSYEKSFIESFD